MQQSEGRAAAGQRRIGEVFKRIVPTHEASLLAILATCVAGAAFAVQGWMGFGIADEGFLWYGVQRVLSGEVPLRDFMAYDPGRYYLSAALMAPFGNDGIVALRATQALVQAAALFVGMRLVRAAGASMPAVLASGLIFYAWFFLGYKSYDLAVTLILVAALSRTVRRPDKAGWFVAGAAVGLAAVVGRNHGLYGLAGCMLLWLTMALPGRDRHPGFTVDSAWGLAGLATGYLPALLMIAFVPGFAAALYESIRFHFEFGATNLALPVPWPWAIDYTDASPSESLRLLILGGFFLLLPVLSVLLVVWVGVRVIAGRSLPPVMTAAALLTPGYAHYALSRADLDHLAMGVLPVLVVLVTASARLGRLVQVAAFAFILGASWVLTAPRHPLLEACGTASGGCVEHRIGRDRLSVDRHVAKIVQDIERMNAGLGPDQTIFVAPLWPGAYALLGKPSPVWEIYALFPRSEEFQIAEIKRLQQASPPVACLSSFPIDGRDELSYFSTHPMIVRYLVDRYVWVGNIGDCELYRLAR